MGLGGTSSAGAPSIGGGMDDEELMEGPSIGGGIMDDEELMEGPDAPVLEVMLEDPTSIGYDLVSSESICFPCQAEAHAYGSVRVEGRPTETEDAG